jgi:hypothetical protein
MTSSNGDDEFDLRLIGDEGWRRRHIRSEIDRRRRTAKEADSNGDDEFDLRLIGDSIGVPAVVVMMSFWRCVSGDSERFRRWFPATGV